MEVNEQIKEIRIALRLAMNGVASQSMREKGLVYKLNFGVELPRIKEIANRFEKNHNLAQALWKEDIREFKILAGLLQPINTFYHEIADIWIDDMHYMEIAELTVMNLFQHLPYAPAKSFNWIASEKEYAQIVGYLTIARLLTQKGDMEERALSEFLDQAIAASLSGTYHVKKAAMLAISKFMQHSNEHAFMVCRLVEKFADSDKKEEQLVYNMVKEEIESQKNV